MTELEKRLLSTPKVLGSNPREAQTFQKPFKIFFRNIIWSGRPTRWTRVISSWFNRKIVTARELGQVSWLRITLVGKARPKHWKWPLDDPLFKVMITTPFIFNCYHLILFWLLGSYFTFNLQIGEWLIRVNHPFEGWLIEPSFE